MTNIMLMQQSISQSLSQCYNTLQLIERHIAVLGYGLYF